MASLQEQIQQYEQEIKAITIANAAELEDFRIRFLGAKGIVKQIFGEMKNVPADQRKEAGQLLNSFKILAEETFESFKGLQVDTKAKGPAIDNTLPGTPLPIGTRHPLRVVENKIVSIFERIGFSVATGPEIEDDWHNFTSLNMPEHHPARDMQDTFYVSTNPDWVLRTHTSSTQARILETEQLPIRVICPGRVYRNETISARAHCFFHQCEGLYVDKNVSFADLKQTLYYFVTEMFGENTKVRFRPSYFPFTEPSAEMDISCTVCGGSGCNLCKHTGWVEILGCGMVHPNMLRNFGIDPEVYTGFAFGMGVERITQVKYQVNDLRMYSQNDVRFLRQFQAIT
ncbi:phenylalanine--tRNA ligase subunit alpha [Flavipsychrobacter stenotrophus]|uniref:Phenylalanine--tRNA ligase alpha subunit n=1 Tax=Flavipsychrobacter stenotrophus TaxID=2077091 RepID=A0A2S7SUH1_9BACT|nr:phenylalanine--tRNA ligase subunit alpha [Flavipsychrobacter stenotrophus]PQJ10560.1 phenylalanine--tRNA ligase subunit alpha [Flavipsychrobacter stenotrophus]